MDKMPQELLILTLRKVYVSGGNVVMWPLLFVCKKWTPIAERILHEHIKIATARGLKSLRGKLFSGLYDGVEHVGHHIQSLDVPLKIDEATNADVLRHSLVCILDNTSSLRSFTAPDFQVGYAHMACLYRSCAATLSTLHLVISGRLTGAFHIINQLLSLHTLNLRFDDLHNPHLWTHPQEHCLHLPAVRDLEWTWPHLCDRAMVQFLAGCTFGERLIAHLKIPQLEATTASSLIPFFNNNTLLLLIFHAHPSSQSVLAPHLMRNCYLHLSLGPPSLALLQHKCLPKHFEIDYAGDFEALLLFLNAMLTEQFEFHQSGRIKLIRNFSWVGGEVDENQAIFVGRLLPVAAALLRQDVRLLDNRNEDITSLTRDVQPPR